MYHATRNSFIKLTLEFAFTTWHKIALRAALAGEVEFAVISGYSNKDNVDWSTDLWQQLDAYQFPLLPGKGSYKEVDESSIMVFPRDGEAFTYEEILILELYGNGYQQESILFSRDGKTWLSYLRSDSSETIGNGFIVGADVSCDDACSQFGDVVFSAAFTKAPTTF